MTVDRCVTNLDEAIAAAAALGLNTDEAVAARDTARARLGFAADAYVLALCGGTGVGKSTLLNAIAGADVSPATARRPTTAEPVAWVPADRAGELADLLRWLGVHEVRTHSGGSLPDVAVLDLPDFDSIAREHRERVDALLPRVDAVAWVVDPEKYKDHVMHGGYLSRFAPRIARQVVVLNRADLLGPMDAARVTEDMRAQVQRDGAGDIEVVATRAREGAGGIAELRAWLESGVEAKRVVVARVAAEARDAVRSLAVEGGVLDQAASAVIEPARRERAIAAVAGGALAIVDIAGLERQAVAATRFAARRRGAGPLRHVTSAVYRLTGRARTAADPAGFVTRWRLRGSLAPAVEPLRELIASTLPTVPASLRGTVASLSAPGSLEAALRDAIDRAVTSEATRFRVPTSRLWSAIGAMQYLVTGALLFSALWLATLFTVHDVPVGTVAVPYLGPVPAPVVLLAATLVLGYLLAKLLQLHAGLLGRRWAKRVGAAVSGEVRRRVGDEILLPLDRFDASRAALGRAARAADECE